jgi:hypothetical protein
MVSCRIADFLDLENSDCSISSAECPLREYLFGSGGADVLLGEVLAAV